MSTINLEFGFNVPRQLIYEALTDQMYSLSHLGKLCNILAQKLEYRINKVDNSSF